MARQRARAAEELRTRTAELAELRDQRAELEVADDRARMSLELDALLQERLGQLRGPLAPSSGRLDADAPRR